MTGYASSDLVTISGYIPLSEELRREIELARMGPLLGPPVPAPLALRRRLGGHPFGAYRRPA